MNDTIGPTLFESCMSNSIAKEEVKLQFCKVVQFPYSIMYYNSMHHFLYQKTFPLHILCYLRFLNFLFPNIIFFEVKYQPCNLGTPFSFFCHEINIPKSATVWKPFPLSRLKAVKCSLLSCPCGLTFFPSKILLCGECRLVKSKQKHTYKYITMCTKVLKWCTSIKNKQLCMISQHLRRQMNLENNVFKIKF